MKKLVFGIIGMLVFSNFPAFANGKLFPCKSQKDSNTLSCELRLESETEFSTAKNINGDKSSSVEFTSFKNLKPAASMYFLIDSGKMIERNAFLRFKTIIEKSMKPGSTGYAVYKFSRALEPIAPLGTPQETIRLAINSVKQDSDLTEGLAALDSFFQILEADKSEKRTIVLLSDGNFSDSAYSTKEISDKLKSLNVSVIAVSPRNSSEAVTSAQPIRRLAIETEGEFLTAPNSNSIDQIVPKIVAMNELGGFFRFTPVAKSSKLIVDVTTGQLTIDVSAGDNWQPQQPEKASEVVSGTAEAIIPIYQLYIDEVRKDPLKLGLVFGASVVLLALMIYGIRSAFRRKKFTAPSNEHEVVPIRPRPVAYFEFLDGNSSTLPIYAGTVRIGRHESNDITLRNTSVHRQHAVVSSSSSGVFTIMDLNTENGVIVNGEKVTRAELLDHDLIELGEVRLRFRIA